MTVSVQVGGAEETETSFVAVLRSEAPGAVVEETEDAPVGVRGRDVRPGVAVEVREDDALREILGASA